MTTDKKLNEVIRVRKQPNSFVMMDKGFLENASLSWKAKGILAYLLSKPDDWKVIVGDVIKRAADGKAAVYSGLDELRRFGHYAKVAVRSGDGRHINHWESTVYELPQAVNPNDASTSLLPDFQEIDNQDIDNQDLENRERSNNYKTKIDTTNNDSQSCPSAPISARVRGGLTDGGIRELETLLKANIRYEDFQEAQPDDMRLVDEILAVMLDALTSKVENIRLDGEHKHRELVNRRLMELGHRHIGHVVGQFKAVTEPIKSKRRYLLAMLYNSTMELDAHNTNGESVQRGREQAEAGKGFVPAYSGKKTVIEQQYNQREYIDTVGMIPDEVEKLKKKKPGAYFFSSGPSPEEIEEMLKL